MTDCCLLRTWFQRSQSFSITMRLFRHPGNKLRSKNGSGQQPWARDIRGVGLETIFFVTPNSSNNLRAAARLPDFALRIELTLLIFSEPAMAGGHQLRMGCTVCSSRRNQPTWLTAVLC